MAPACSITRSTGPLRELAGIEVSDLAPLHSPVLLRAEAIPGISGGEARFMADEIHPRTSHVLATFDGGWRRGLPAITINTCGAGSVVYLGAVLEGAAPDGFVRYLRGLADAPAVADTPSGGVAHERRGGGIRLLFLLNYNDIPTAVMLPHGWRDAFTGQRCNEVEIAPVDMRLLIS